MKRTLRTSFIVCFFAVFFGAGYTTGESMCGPDGRQQSGSIYRICMPPPGEYNGSLVIWAHGFQDAGTRVHIPEEQLGLESFAPYIPIP